MKLKNIHQARSHLSKLVELAFAGEEIIICKAGKPMAKLIKYQQSEQPRTPGSWKGQVTISKDFDELPKHLGAAFRGDAH